MLNDVYLYNESIDIDNYDIKERIGSGAFGIVFRAIQKDTGEEVALKAIQLTDKLNQQKEQRNILLEICIPRKLNLPGTVKFLGFRFPLTDEQKKTEKIVSITTTNKDGKGRETVDLTGAIMVTQLMKNGNLESLTKIYLESRGVGCPKMNPTIRSKIIFGISATMKYVHKKKVIHRDLKPDNIFLDENFEPKIADFGLSKIIMDKINMTVWVGTPFFMAPELFMNEDEDGSYTNAVDVYAFAFILYKMFTNSVFFSDKKPIRGKQQYMMKIGRKFRPIKPELIPDPYWELIQRCWAHDPVQRPTFAEITDLLRNDIYAIEEFGMSTDLDQLHEYQDRIDVEPIPLSPSTPTTSDESLIDPNRQRHFNWDRH
ncbi:hypothetical protein M9Y10_039415 [Tritrichomonas musculus]|uniref:Protein kinase domain-containing protein n=1 Tax=Tritrichomonas musculus TaxID=1915356 RepID=A0ABR2KD38_9EUKA